MTGMKMRNSRFAFYSLILLLLAGCTGTDSKKQFIGENMNYACEQTRYMLESLGDTNGRYPRSTKKDGRRIFTDGQAAFFRALCGSYTSSPMIAVGKRRQWNGHCLLNRTELIRKTMMSVL
jgi:hypothetical protein